MRSIPVDVCEEAKEFKLFASLPGVDKSRIDLSVDGDTIQFSITESKVRVTCVRRWVGDYSNETCVLRMIRKFEGRLALCRRGPSSAGLWARPPRSPLDPSGFGTYTNGSCRMSRDAPPPARVRRPSITQEAERSACSVGMTLE